MKNLPLSVFPAQSFDKLRYADTDRQGHVNNAVFSSFLETGRVEFLYDPAHGIQPPGTSFVIASLHLQFLREINWPGLVHIGTGIIRIGNSSMNLVQNIYQNDQVVAHAETVVVLVDNETSKATPLSEQAKLTLQKWIVDPNATS